MDKGLAAVLCLVAISLGTLLLAGLICLLNPPSAVLTRKVVRLLGQFRDAEAVVSAYAQVLQRTRSYPTFLRPLSELPAPKASIIAAFHLVGLRDALIGRLDVKLADLNPREASNWGDARVRDGLVRAYGHLADFVADDVAKQDFEYQRAFFRSMELQQQGSSVNEAIRVFEGLSWPAAEVQSASKECGWRLQLFRAYLAAAEDSIGGTYREPIARRVPDGEGDHA